MSPNRLAWQSDMDFVWTGKVGKLGCILSHYATLSTSNEYRLILPFFSYDMARKGAHAVSGSIAETAVETGLLYEVEEA